MNPIRSHIARFISTFLLASIALFGAALVSAWTGPSAAPPNSNTATPINTSATTQDKAGQLQVESLRVDTSVDFYTTPTGAQVTYFGKEVVNTDNYGRIVKYGGAAASPNTNRMYIQNMANGVSAGAGGGGFLDFLPSASKLSLYPPNAGTVDVVGKLEANEYCFNNNTGCVTSFGGGMTDTQFFSVLLPNGSQRIASNDASLQQYCSWKGYVRYTGASRFFESNDAIYTWNGSAWVYYGDGAGITYVVCAR